MALLLTILIVGLLLLANEFWVRRLSQPTELSRKFIHITVGSFVAFWPFFLSWPQIIGLSAAFVLVVSISKYFHIFSAIHSVQRPTYGEIFFGAAVGLVALITQDHAIYAVALLHMSLADGLAAVIGMRYGASSGYKILGATKSVAGTATFLLVSVGLLVGFNLAGDITVALPVLAGLAITASLLENLGAYGLDNLFVPLLIAIVLNA